MGIHKTLAQIERELIQTTNPNCRVGLLKNKAEILFKLIEVQRSIANEDELKKRIQTLERKLEFLDSGKQNGET